MKTKTVSKRTKTRADSVPEAVERCRVAKDLENIGDYEEARAALADLWEGIGRKPRVKGLPTAVQAEVLLRVGTLTGWLGSAQQHPGAQALAKDLISEGMRAFAAEGNGEKLAEAQTELAICYWREGAFDEARIWFREALARATSPQSQLRVLVNSTIVEISTNRPTEAVALLDRAAPLLEEVDDLASKGRYYMQRAIVLTKLGSPAELDEALIENAVAVGYFEKARHARYVARVKNNTGFILFKLQRYPEALSSFDRARRILNGLGDLGTAAQVNESRARVFLARGQYREAERAAFSAASRLEQGGEQSLLAEALITQATALARLGRGQTALAMFKRAASIAENAGDPATAGLCFLVAIEELKEFLSPVDMVSFYQQADQRLSNGLDQDTVVRLRACVRLILSRLALAEGDGRKCTGSLLQETKRYEGELIRDALAQTDGSVTRAAKILGLNHQSLGYIISARHKALLAVRRPVRVRCKSHKR